MLKGNNVLMENFSYTISKDGHIVLIRLNGRLLESDQTNRLIQEVDNTISNVDNKVILDLENIEYINSNGLNCFIQILTKSRNMGGEAIIINVPKKIEKLLLISKLNTVFTIKNSLEQANEILLTD